MNRNCAAAIAWLLFSVAAAHAQTEIPVDLPASSPSTPFTPAPVVRLVVSPATVHINGGQRRKQLLVTAELSTGRQIDATHRAQFIVENTANTASQAVAAVAGAVVEGLVDGRSELRVRYEGAETVVPIIVTQLESPPPVHFSTDIVPLFAKLGCNSGGCHGKSSGQNGFRLSVFGFNPAADYDALVKEARGRRLFPAAAEKSLLVAKALARTPHGGGKRMNEGSDDHRLLVEWIRQGTPWGDQNAPQVIGIELEPDSRVLAPEADQQILVTAMYSDESRRDVTSAASYTSNAEAVARVEPNGRVFTGRTPGEAAITVNYMGHVGTVRVLVPRSSAPQPYPDLPSRNPIDPLVWAKLEKLGIVPSTLCDDATFLRRLHLDTIGTLPRPETIVAFLADDDPAKRIRAIDEVLQREEFADYWALKWSDILLVNRDKLGDRGAFEFHRWLREQISLNRPYDQWVRELITASGNSAKIGPVNFYRALRTPEELARAVSQAFVGIRLDCAQCHHHPFDRWGQDDFYALAGFFNGIERKPLADDRELVFHGGYQPTTLPLTGATVATRPLAAPSPASLSDGDPRIALAEWLTARDNPWFARLVANRLWKHFLGRGLVEPEDDLRSTNPATNEPLLAFLAEQVVTSRYDLRAVMRLILNSTVYQLSSDVNATNQDDEQNFSHHLVRRLPAEVLLDAISQVTGTPEDFAGMPPGTRAIQLWDNRLPSYFLDTFGRSQRESPCECGKSSEPTMAQAMHLMNAPEIEAKIGSPDGRIHRLVEAGIAPETIVEELCLAALGRPSNEHERLSAAKLFLNQPPRQAAEDFLWTLLNSYDFLFVH